MYKHILVPTDGSPLSLKAVGEAAALAKKLDAKITALYVSAPFMPPASETLMPRQMDTLQEVHRKTTEDAAGRALEAVKQATTSAAVAFEAVHASSDQPWDCIIREAKQRQCDLVVMASHGRRGLAGVLLGSETVKVLTHSNTPVLVCR